MHRKACCYGKTLLCISEERRKIHISLKSALEQRCSAPQEAGSRGCPPHLRRQNSSLLSKDLAGVAEKGWAPSCWVQVHLRCALDGLHHKSGHCRGQKASLTSPSGHQHRTDLASPKERILQSWSSFFAWFCISTGGEGPGSLGLTETGGPQYQQSEAAQWSMSIPCSWTASAQVTYKPGKLSCVRSLQLLNLNSTSLSFPQSTPLSKTS